MRVLLIEDDRLLAEAVSRMLEMAGFTAYVASLGEDALDLVRAYRFDLILLDLMMAGEDGLSICRRLRATMDVPILIVTAKGEDIDRVIGLELGADDYLAKPFNSRELVARVRAILRRTRESHRVAPVVARVVYRLAQWSLDVASRELRDASGANIELTTGEFDLLLTFLEHPQRVLNRDQLLDWTRGRGANPLDRTIDVQLSRLRRKLGDDPRAPAVIRTVRGGGYLFAPDVERC
jgi:two-component system OmpR family response regulator